MGIIREAFGVTKNEDRVTKYTMTNQNGMKVSIIDYGAVITNIWMPDKNLRNCRIPIPYSSQKKIFMEKGSRFM